MDVEKAVETTPTPQNDTTAAAIKKALQLELRNKKQCSYNSYECTQLSLDGYAYCPRHILNDKNAPFKQCSCTYQSNGKRCHLPALRGDKKDIAYCNEHALKATLLKNRQNSRYPPPNSAEAILTSLSHYVKKPRSRTYSQQSDESASSSAVGESSDTKTVKSLDPFTDIDALGLFNSQCNDVLGYCSDSESDVEPASLSSVWHDDQADSSDNESIDSEHDDYLKHANVYTAEEITSITKDKLIKLQSLYIEEYRHLQYLLKEKRRKYLHALKREKETCCNISNQIRDNPKEQRLYKKLKAFNSYHKPHGVDAILTKRLHNLRSKKPQTFTKCLFTEGGVKCGERTLPLAKHCRKHILEETHQVLFRPCGKIRADVECRTPIEIIFDDATCTLHTDIPPLKSYSVMRKDSESDYDEVPDATLDDFHNFASVKTEFIDEKTEEPKMPLLPPVFSEDSTNDGNKETEVNLSIVKTEDCDTSVDSDNTEQKCEESAIDPDESYMEMQQDNQESDEISRADSKMDIDEQFQESTDTASETVNDNNDETSGGVF